MFQKRRRNGGAIIAAYSYKAGFRLKLDAQTVGEELERIERKGPLTPKAVVDASRRKNSKLHSLFEWDDATAAELYRESQASYIIRSVEVTVSGTSNPVRAFVSVSSNGGGYEYISVEAAMSEQHTRDEVLEKAITELRMFEKKYAGLAELAGVIEAIRQVA